MLPLPPSCSSPYFLCHQYSLFDSKISRYYILYLLYKFRLWRWSYKKWYLWYAFYFGLVLGQLQWQGKQFLLEICLMEQRRRTVAVWQYLMMMFTNATTKENTCLLATTTRHHQRTKGSFLQVQIHYTTGSKVINVFQQTRHHGMDMDKHVFSSIK